MKQGSKVFMTGGSGTLGKAIVKRATEENWDCEFTVFSTDTMKHAKMRAKYPHVRYLVGDVRDYGTLHNAIAGHDIVLHLAAVKHIPVSEINSIDTIGVNIDGSLNVLNACVAHQVKQVLGISTDKAAAPANLYGATKMAMEKAFQEYARFYSDLTTFNLVRYGNVLESTGSVVELWKNTLERGEKIKVTDPNMTRFWISPSMAVDFVLLALDEPSGTITVPFMKALPIGKLAEYAVGVEEGDWDIIPLRPGEKIHETLVTINEVKKVQLCFRESLPTHIRLYSTSHPDIGDMETPYTSADEDFRMSNDELMEILGDGLG